MSFWILFWRICLVTALAIFGVMTVLVTYNGAGDIRRFLSDDTWGCGRVLVRSGLADS